MGIMDELEKSAAKDSGTGEVGGGRLLGLPETETELDNLTEFNTAHNRRITMLGISDGDGPGGGSAKKKRKIRITFNEEEDVINPEDVDPSIGRFRNMVTTSIIPNKPKKPQDMGLGLVEDKPEERSLPKEVPQPQAGLYDDLETGAFSRTL